MAAEVGVFLTTEQMLISRLDVEVKIDEEVSHDLSQGLFTDVCEGEKYVLSVQHRAVHTSYLSLPHSDC